MATDEAGRGTLGLGIDLVIDQGGSARAPATAPFEQLRVQVRDAVASGALAAGVRLPTVRALAAALGLAVNTVARAYRELEADGLIETRGRLGSFVSATGSPVQREVQAAARVFADRVDALGADHVEALRLAAAALGLREGARGESVDPGDS